LQQNAAAFAGGFLAFACVGLIVGILIASFFLMTIQRALSLCAPRNRSMEPPTAWLNLVPIYGFYWGFRTVNELSDSLQREFVDRGLDDGSDYGRNVGTWLAGLNVGSFVLNLFGRAPELWFFNLLLLPLGIAELVLFILYWVRIHGYNKWLALGDIGNDGRDDEDDDRPRRRRRGPSSTDIRSNEKDDRYT